LELCNKKAKMSIITENDIELYTIEELEKQGFRYVYGPTIAPDGEQPERQQEVLRWANSSIKK
jgi:hypothetical protein